MAAVSKTINNNKSTPFFNWVGGKRKLTDKFLEYIPAGLSNYYEPFLGGGALFFAVKGMFKKYFLSDINLELVTSYNAVKKDPKSVSSNLDSHIEKHSKEYYYQIRDCNNTNNPSLISARFLYLNRYSFKGIYRMNKNGGLSSSFSDRKYKHKENKKLENYSSLLKEATIYASDFSFIEPKENDFVYFDPPYHKAGERFYTRMPFNEQDQIRLRDFAKELTAKGVKLMISNSDTDFIRSIYSDFNIKTVSIKYSINGQQKLTQELVVRNY